MYVLAFEKKALRLFLLLEQIPKAKSCFIIYFIIHSFLGFLMKPVPFAHNQELLLLSLRLAFPVVRALIDFYTWFTHSYFHVSILSIRFYFGRTLEFLSILFYFCRTY